MGVPRYESPSIFENPDNSTVSKHDMAEAGLLAYFSIAGEWGINTSEQRTLLGNPGRSRFFELKAGKTYSVSDDELDRLAYVLGIYSALNILYSPENAILWLKNSSEPGSIWRGQSPLAYLLTGKMMALIDVYRYLNGLRGAA